MDLSLRCRPRPEAVFERQSPSQNQSRDGNGFSRNSTFDRHTLKVAHASGGKLLHLSYGGSLSLEYVFFDPFKG